MANDTILIDDSDPSITYGPAGAWTLQTAVPQAQSLTLHSASSYPAWAILKFNGTSVNVFGAVDSTSGESEYLLDDQLSGSVFTPPNETDFRIWFYTSASLPYGEHTLNISLTKPGKTLSLDYFQVTGSLPPPDARTGASSGASSSHKLSGGAIAGIIVALCVLLVLLVVLVLILSKLYWRRKHQMPSFEQDSDILGPEMKAHQRAQSFIRLRVPPRAHTAVTRSSTTAMQSTVVFSSVFSVYPMSSSAGASIPDTNGPSRTRHVR